jgi:hypothetical protein
LAEGRAANAARLHAETANLKLSIEVDEVILQKVDDSRLSRLRELRFFSEKIIQSHSENVKTEADRRVRIVAGQQALEAVSKQLSTVAGGLAALAKEDEPRARLEFLGGFVQTVVKEVQDRQKDKEGATKSVEAGIKKGASTLPKAGADGAGGGK